MAMQAGSAHVPCYNGPAATCDPDPLADPGCERRLAGPATVGAMTTVFEKPVVCPVLIGRAAYVRVLTRCIAEARGRQGRAVLVAGEAGIGKSRLVAGAKTCAGDEGPPVLQRRRF